MKTKITKAAVESAIATGKAVDLRDTEVTGLMLRVRPTGRHTYFFRYVTKDGVERKPRIGEHGPLTPQQARDLARQMALEVATGKDPAGDARATRLAPTMVDLRDKYMAEWADVRKAESSRSNDRSMWQVHILPAMGKKKVAAVTEADVAALHAKLTAAGKRTTANRVRALLSKAFNLAERWRWRERNTNPTTFVEKNRERKRRSALDDAAITRLGTVLRAWAERPGYEAQVARYIRLLVLTGARPHEVRDALKADVDLARGALRVTANKEQDEHKVLALPPAAVAIVRDQIKSAPFGDYLFPSPRRAGQAMDRPHRAWKRICVEARLPVDLHLHDLRHTFASAGLALGYSFEQIGELLGHSDAETTQVYAYLLDDPRRQAADAIGSRLAALGV